MRPPPWHPPVEPSPTEQTILRLIKRAKLFVFLRQHRHDLFDDAFQQDLGTIYKDSSFGHPPVPPAQLALAPILVKTSRIPPRDQMPCAAPAPADLGDASEPER